MAGQYLEDLIYRLLVRSLSDKEKQRLHNWYDLTNHVDEESREDMKDALFDFVLNSINYHRVICQLQDTVTEEEAEKDEEEEDDAGW